MIKVRNAARVNASPEEVWRILGDLVRAPEYVPGVVTARMEGMVRVCRDTYGNEIREELSDYSPEKRAYRFRHLKVPLPVQRSEGSFSVESDGTGALVRLDWEVEPVDPARETEMAPLIDGASKQTLERLRDRVESSKLV